MTLYIDLTMTFFLKDIVSRYNYDLSMNHMAKLVFEPGASRSSVQHSTTEPPGIPSGI